MSHVVIKTKKPFIEVMRNAHANFQAFGEALVDAAKSAPAQGGAPVDTGNLRDSIRLEGGTGRLGFRVRTTTAQGAGEDRGYGYWVHEGTSRTPPNPFFVRAYDTTRKDFEEAWQ